MKYFSELKKLNMTLPMKSVLEAAANVKAHAIVTYNLREFGPAKFFRIPVLSPEQTFQNFRLTVTRRTEP